MSDISLGTMIGIPAILLYFAAPFLNNAGMALIFRILSEGFCAMVFLSYGYLAGVSYYGFLLLSVLFEKKIEQNHRFSLLFGILAAAVTIAVNNSGVTGIVLGLSLILVFLHVDEEKMLMTSSYLEVLTALILAWYCMDAKITVMTVFAVILLIFAIVGMISSITLSRRRSGQSRQSWRQKLRRRQRKRRSTELLLIHFETESADADFLLRFFLIPSVPYRHRDSGRLRALRQESGQLLYHLPVPRENLSAHRDS